MHERSLQEQIAAFPRWMYEFDLGGIRTPADPAYRNRHIERERYFFTPLIDLFAGTLEGKRVSISDATPAIGRCCAPRRVLHMCLGSTAGRCTSIRPSWCSPHRASSRIAIGFGPRTFWHGGSGRAVRRCVEPWPDVPHLKARPAHRTDRSLRHRCRCTSRRPAWPGRRFDRGFADCQSGWALTAAPEHLRALEAVHAAG